LDVDGDGIPDPWEETFGLDSGNAADGGLDTDNDGASNRDEYLAGTNPTNELSVLRLSMPDLGSGLATLQFVAASNRTYSVQFIDSLGLNWQRLGDVLNETSVRTETVVDPSGNTNRFYRVVTPRQP
jgi:hypothetical protein